MKKIYIKYAGLVSMIVSLSCFAFAQLDIAESIDSPEGERISLDLKGMDVVEVLKTLAAKGNMNLIIGANVRGRVTMFLKDVDVKEAFEIILLANSLAIEKRDDIIYVMTQKEYTELYGREYGDTKEAKIIQLRYAKVETVAKALNQIKTKVGKIITDDASNTVVIIDVPAACEHAMRLIAKLDKPMVTKVFELSYAKAEDIKEKIREFLTKDVGVIQVDERTNKIVITDMESKIYEIEQVIHAFDSKLSQVLIDAKIVEITLSDAYKLGVDWEGVLNDLQKRLFPLMQNNPITVTGSFNLASAGSLTPGVEVRIGEFGEGDYAAMIQALQTVGDTNLLSSPRITVLNNQEAKILVGSSTPYATNTVTQGTSTTTTGTDLQFLDIGVKLFVTPTINSSGYVTVKIKPEISSQSGTYKYGSPETEVPIVSTTQAETIVTVKDGATVIIAGLIKDERSGEVSKIPFLGDIPFFGAAFRKTDNTVQKKELVIFLTPRIISGDNDYLKIPESPPIGDDIFTVSENPTFEPRRPKEMSPGYLREKPSKKKRVTALPDMRDSSQDEYFYAITDRIMKNLSEFKKDKRIASGDSVIVSFVLFSGGELAAKPEIIESTNIYFNNIAIKAVEKSAPFPAFPSVIDEGRKRFTLELVYELGGKDEKGSGGMTWKK